MKLTSIAFIFCALVANVAMADIGPVAGRYTVVFNTITASCTGKEYTDSATLNFGERDSAGRCLDNTALNCTKRFTLSLGKAFGAEPLLATDGPHICTSSGKNCVEVQFSFGRTPKGDEDLVNLGTYGHRGGHAVKGESAMLKASMALEQSRRYVISLDACHYTFVDFKLTPR